MPNGTTGAAADAAATIEAAMSAAAVIDFAVRVRFSVSKTLGRLFCWTEFLSGDPQ